VQIIELKRFRGAPNGYPFAAIICLIISPFTIKLRCLNFLIIELCTLCTKGIGIQISLMVSVCVSACF
jgi:hypothetical protein